MSTRSRPRRGYTLLETALVGAVILILATLSYPALKSSYGYYKLQGAIDSVRAAWAQARSRAIEEGRPYRFALEEGGTHFRVAPDNQDYWSGSVPSDDPEGVGLVLEQAVPAGVGFTVNGDASTPAPELPEKEEVPPPSGQWSITAVFLPDGTAKQNVRILFQHKGVTPKALQLRGLTGTVTVQSVNP